MRPIKHIVLHCTATSQEAKVSSILNYWKNTLGWQYPGYHFIIDVDGNITQLLEIEKPSNGVKGHNANSIHISYIGGVDSQNKAFDTRTHAQYTAISGLVKALHAVYPKAKVLGHCDFPGVSKACPSFNVSDFLSEIQLEG